MISSAFTKIYRNEIVYGCLYALSHSFIFHNSELWWLAHLAVIPLLAGIRNCSSKSEALGFGYVAGLASNLITFYWMYPVTAFGYLAMCFYLAIYPALFAFLAFKDISVLNRNWQSGGYFLWIKIISVAGFWILSEYFQVKAPVLAFGWGLLALSQTGMLPMIQIADIFGQLGVSLIVIFNNTALFYTAGLMALFIRRQITVKPLVFNLAVIAVLLGGVNCFNWQYAKTRMSAIEQVQPVSHSKVALIQGNIPQNQKWNAQIKKLILDKYLGLSRQAAMDQPELMIWPETSFPGYWEYEPVMTNEITQLARGLKTSILIGTPTFREGVSGIERMNSAIQLSPDGHEMDRHHKLRLVPYGEYIPFFKFIRKINDDIGRFSSGTKMTLFKLPVEPEDAAFPKYFSVLICFEDTFADLCRRFVNRGANMLVNITNDGWFGTSTAAYQHAQASAMRAVENRVPVLRSANTGVSCYIDPLGRTAAVFEDGGTPIMVTGFLNVNVELKALPKTIYTRYGETWLLALLLIGAASSLAYHPQLSLSESKDYGY